MKDEAFGEELNYFKPFSSHLLPKIFERDPYLLEQFFCPKQLLFAAVQDSDFDPEEFRRLQESDCVRELLHKKGRWQEEREYKRWNQHIEYILHVHSRHFKYDKLCELVEGPPL